jgi:hypothetical protein
MILSELALTLGLNRKAATEAQPTNFQSRY